jgi:ABC-type antimicrobial peptide transport system permease subunit
VRSIYLIFKNEKENDYTAAAFIKGRTNDAILRTSIFHVIHENVSIKWCLITL